MKQKMRFELTSYEIKEAIVRFVRDKANINRSCDRIEVVFTDEYEDILTDGMVHSCEVIFETEVYVET